MLGAGQASVLVGSGVIDTACSHHRSCHLSPALCPLNTHLHFPSHVHVVDCSAVIKNIRDCGKNTTTSNHRGKIWYLNSTEVRNEGSQSRLPGPRLSHLQVK